MGSPILACDGPLGHLALPTPSPFFTLTLSALVVTVLVAFEIFSSLLLPLRLSFLPPKTHTPLSNKYKLSLQKKKNTLSKSLPNYCWFLQFPKQCMSWLPALTFLPNFTHTL
jgi:hypothetical protein